MKLVVHEDDDCDTYTVIYHPDICLKAMAIADAKGWCDRRMAIPTIDLGEVWYTQDPEINDIYDCFLGSIDDGIGDCLRDEPPCPDLG